MYEFYMHFISFPIHFPYLFTIQPRIPHCISCQVFLVASGCDGFSVFHGLDILEEYFFRCSVSSILGLSDACSCLITDNDDLDHLVTEMVSVRLPYC